MADPAGKHAHSLKLINISSPRESGSSSSSSRSSSPAPGPSSPQTPNNKPSQEEITALRKRATEIETSLKRISKSMKKRRALSTTRTISATTGTQTPLSTVVPGTRITLIIEESPPGPHQVPYNKCRYCHKIGHTLEDCRKRKFAMNLYK